MRAMVLTRAGEALEPVDLPLPTPGPRQVVLQVRACGVCRTDLHIVDGELRDAPFPITLGHEVVGTVIARGPDADDLALDARVGVPWLGWSCGVCPFCLGGRENLCDRARFTGYHLPGGYAEYVVADARYCLALPDSYGDASAAPLLCAGLIGYRSLRRAGDAARLGLYGFGAAAHLVAQVARQEGRRVFAFTRRGDNHAQALARELGVAWAGDSESVPPEPLDAAIIFAPVGPLVPSALAAVVKGGSVVCAGIHMSDIPAFPYELLWGERTVCSVANLTRQDGIDFLALAAKTPLHTAVRTFALDDANAALEGLRTSTITGAAVLVP